MKNNQQSGQSLLSLLFLIALFAASSALITLLTLRSTRIKRNLVTQIEATHVAEAGLNKALYCLNSSDSAFCGGSSGDTYVGESGLSFGDGVVTTSVTEIDQTSRLITALATVGTQDVVVTQQYNKTVPSEEIEYYSSIVAGTGGVLVTGNSQITGDVYANGPVSCTAGIIDNDLYVSDQYTVDGCTVGGEIRAHDIQNSAISRDAYYQTIANTTVGGISYPGSPDQPPAPELISAEVIDEWKVSASEGGVWTGSMTVDQNTSLGPIEITGDLVITGATLTITGTVYVRGNVNNGGTLKLSDAYGANGGGMISDGVYTMSGGAKFQGSAGGGIVLLVSTTSADPAIEFDAGIGQSGLQVGLYAPNGTIRLDGGTKLLQVSAYRIIVGGGAKIEFTENILSFQFVDDVSATPYWVKTPMSRIE